MALAGSGWEKDPRPGLYFKPPLNGPPIFPADSRRYDCRWRGKNSSVGYLVAGDGRDEPSRVPSPRRNTRGALDFK